ncbi:MAG: ABC transporter permease [Myxococcota bacterium]|nr:ABC transporter permease [Myxococcales bacterium]
MSGLDPYVWSNLVTVALVVGGLALARFVRGQRLWREASVELWRRRRVAIVVVGVYLVIALLDSIAWKGGVPEGTVGVLPNAPLTVVDRLFLDTKEASYSVPLADVEFYGGRPLRRPGTHLLGTDILGRDVLYMSLKGARVALLIGGLTSLIAIPIALFFGVGAGYFGGRFDDFVFFLISTLASMPGILLLIALIMVMGRGTLSVCVALAVTGWVGFCRLSRAETLKLRELDYVVAARALGVSEPRIIWRHVLPNLAHLIVITFVLMFSGLVLSEAVLSWLGIGVDGSWGQMIDGARDELSREPIVWWNIGAAGTALFGLILAVNAVGDAVRDVLDPRTLRAGE